MRKTALVFGLLSSALLVSCGPLLGQKKTEYVPDYTLTGIPKKTNIWTEEFKRSTERWFKSYTRSVEWIRYYRRHDLLAGTIIKNTYTVGDWEVKIVGRVLTAVHTPTGREYKLSLRNPFPMEYRAVAKAVGDKLYVKEAIDGKTYILDPTKEIKEVGTIPRAYLYDDGIVIVGGTQIKFCKNYDMKNCMVIDEIKGKKGKYGDFYRVNGYFVYHVREYSWDKKEKGYRWRNVWEIKDSSGKLIVALNNTYDCYKWTNNGYSYPFWEETDKQYVYNRDDYFSNPYYRSYKDVPVNYGDVAMPRVYVSEKGVYYWCQNRDSLRYDWIKYWSAEEKRVKWKMRVGSWFTSKGFGFCGDTPLFEVDGVLYNPEDGKKVKCEGMFVYVW